MVVKVADVKFNEPVDLRYEGESYNFETGDVATFDLGYAKKIVQRWNLAEYVNRVYEVLDEDLQESIGFKEDFDPVKEYGVEDGESEEDDESEADKSLEDMTYNELQDLAKEHGVKANQKKDELIAELKDVQ